MAGSLAQLAQGRQLYRQGKTALAMSAFLKGLEGTLQADAQAESLYWSEVAELMRAAGQFDRALALHQHALSLAEHAPCPRCLARLGLAADLWTLGEADASRTMLQLALRHPSLTSSPVLLEKLSRLYAQQQEWLLALDTLEAAIARYQNEATAVASCALALLQLHAHVQLPERLSVAVEMMAAHLPHLPHAAREIQIELAQACHRLGRHHDAAMYYQAALQLESQRDRAQPKPRRLLAVEFKLQQTSSDIEIELLRHKNAQQQEQVLQLESTAFRDELTGLHNPRYLQARWPELLGHTRLILMSLGIAQFTQLREVFGQDVAQACSLRVAQVLQRCQPVGSELIMHSPSEFRLILLNASRHDAEQLAVQIAHAMAQIHAGLAEDLTLSIGCTQLQAGDTVDVLQLRADLALYLALRQGDAEIVWEGECT